MWSLIKPKARHLVALLAFVPLLLILLYGVATASEEFLEAEQFVQQDSRLVESIGKSHESTFKFWRGFSFNGGSAEFPFDARTDKGIYGLNVHLQKKAGKWSVTKVEIENSYGSQSQLDLR